jgi:chitodextrinase
MTRLTLCAAAALTLLAPALPAAAAGAGPASPADVNATNGATAITLTWSQPAAGARPVSFRVYEGSTVVGRNTTTHATLRNLVFLSRHTYTVTAVDGSGRESAPSAPITRQALVGGPVGCGLTAPTGLVATEVTASAVALSWSNAQPYWDQPGILVVLVDGAVLMQTPLDSARVGGLAPGSTHTFQVARRDCNGQLHPGAALTGTTLAGSPPRSAAPGGLTVGDRTRSTIALSWAAASGAAAYAVYNGGTRVASTTGTAVTVAGLWRDTTYQFTVAALDAAGGESAGSAPAATTTLPCDQPVPAPVQLSATAVSPSSVALSWVSTVEATSFTVHLVDPDGTATPVATVFTPSAMVTGLPPATALRFAVLSQTGACGASALRHAPVVTTLSGPAARPASPTGLAVTSNIPTGNAASVTLSWTQPTGTDPATAYRLYEGAAVLGTSQTTTLTLQLPSGPTHVVRAVGVDAAGNESAGSAPVTFTAAYIPIP